MNVNEILEDDFKCNVCFEILVNPTSLSCGHSICRYCLAQWWESSRKATCPECRQVWQGFPKVNVTLMSNHHLYIICFRYLAIVMFSGSPGS